MAFLEIWGKERLTSHAFELALSVLFQSGTQHYAEVPEGMAAQPAYGQDFVKKLPPRWADVKFVAGYPGQYAVLAHQAPSGAWYVAGLNGTEVPKTLQIDLGKMGLQRGRLITHGATNRSFSTRTPQRERDAAGMRWLRGLALLSYSSLVIPSYENFPLV